MSKERSKKVCGGGFIPSKSSERSGRPALKTRATFKVKFSDRSLHENLRLSEYRNQLNQT